MNAKQASQVHAHGVKLLKIFPNATEQDPIMLCSKLHRLEIKGQRLALDYCNGVIDSEQVEPAGDRLVLAVIRLLRPDDSAPEIRLNLDPRGYALKIPSEDAARLDIHRDMGGYGILCPEFDGK